MTRVVHSHLAAVREPAEPVRVPIHGAHTAPTVSVRMARAYARSQVRSVRRALRPRPPRAVDLFRPARVDGYELRLLRLSDSGSWSASMRANESRMRSWWPPVADWQKATDEVAFVDHYRQWRRRMRQGAGLALVVAGPSGVLGEITTWHLTRGATAGKTGIWLYPKISRRVFLPLWAAYFDNCFGNIGLHQITAPVAVGNNGPLRLIAEVGAGRVGALPRGTEVAGTDHEYDLYALSRADWLRRRRALFTRHPWPEVTDAFEPLLG